MTLNREGKYILSDQNNVDAAVAMNGGFAALMRELKTSMYEIARVAELADKESATLIQAMAERSLHVIDNYILSAQSEYGQTALDLEPLAIGSVMHEAAYSLRVGQTVTVQAKAQYPVMTHRGALNGLLISAGRILGESSDNPIIMRSFITNSGDVGVGVFAEDLDLTSQDLRTCLELSGKANMPLSRHSSGSGVLLVIADALAKALGGSLEVKRMGKFRGLATVLPRSEQLALI